jgi:ferredoxin
VKRIVIDRSLCSGFGACAELAPHLFEVDGRGLADARQALTTDPAADDAAAACPMGAIAIVEERAA